MFSRMSTDTLHRAVIHRLDDGPGSQGHDIQSDEALREPRAIVITFAFSLQFLHTCNSAYRLPIQMEACTLSCLSQAS